MQWEGNWYDTEDWPKNQYRYNGKELNSDFGLDWYAYGARWYDPGIGRFTGVDPISDGFPNLSPFNYASNSPIRNIDLHGLQALDYSHRYTGLTQSALRQGKDPQKYIEAYHEAQLQNTATFTAGVGSLFLPGPEDIALAGFAATKAGRFVLGKLDDAADAVSSLFRSSRKSIDDFKDCAICDEEAAQIFGAGPTIRNKKLAGKTHPETNVPFDEDGFPDFSEHLYKDGINDVIIKPASNRAKDFDAANKAAGYDSTPKGYTWHHHQDNGRMQLIESDVHKKTGHTGGFSLW